MHSFATLVASDLGIPEALRGARPVLNNRALEAALDDIERQIQAGQALSSAMLPLLPPLALRMIRVGEQSGRLSKSLDDIAATYDREAGEAAERLIGALEPMLTLVVGGLLAWIVLAVLGPIYGSLATLNLMSP